jgi:hypothetical protein
VNASRPFEDWIVGPKVPDPARLRPVEPIADLREFLEFLEAFEDVFGVGKRGEPSRTAPRRFRL